MITSLRQPLVAELDAAGPRFTMRKAVCILFIALISPIGGKAGLKRDIVGLDDLARDPANEAKEYADSAGPMREWAKKAAEGGELIDAARIYEEALHRSVKRLNTDPSRAADLFMTAFTVEQFVNRTLRKANVELGTRLLTNAADSLEALSNVNSEWNPTAVAYRQNQIRSLLASLQKP